MSADQDPSDGSQEAPEALMKTCAYLWLFARQHAPDLHLGIPTSMGREGFTAWILQALPLVAEAINVDLPPGKPESDEADDVVGLWVLRAQDALLAAVEEQESAESLAQD